MLKRSCFALIVTIPLMALGPPHQGDIQVPSKLTFEPSGKAGVHWVAAERIPEGRFDPTDFSELELDILNHQLTTARRASQSVRSEASGDCSLLTLSSSDPDLAMTPPLERIKMAETVLLGRVIGAKAGLLMAEPVTLYSIRIEKILKGGERLGKKALVVFPQATVTVGEETLCTKTSFFPEAPVMGKEVLLAIQSQSADSPVMLNLTEYQIFFELQDAMTAMAVDGERVASQEWGPFVDQILQLFSARNQ